jgi:hypothetical protein
MPLHQRLPAFLLPLILATTAHAGQTIGLFQNDPGTFDGYTLFESMAYQQTYLIDNDGFLVHSWQPNSTVALMSYLLDDGHLLRGAYFFSTYYDNAGAGGMVQEFDWDSNLLWQYVYSDSTHRQHHDIEPLPNGNVLLLAWEGRTAAQAIAAGRNPALIADGVLWPEHIVEIEPVGANGGNIVWEWHVWDHLIQDFDATKENFGVVADHPELVNINFMSGPGRDWLHANSVAYNAELDQIVLSINQNREFWIIDHSTTTEEAAGHTGGARGKGGDLLYRWGNPQAYGRGTAADMKLFRQHDVHWIAPGLPGEGNILLYNNGFERPAGLFSTVEEVVTTVDANGDYPDPAPGTPHGPANALWTYSTPVPQDMYSPIISSAQRLPNGNTSICEGSPVGTFREVDTSDTIVWLYVNPVSASGPLFQGDDPNGNRTFRTAKFPTDYAAFDGRDLTPMGPIEQQPVGVAVAPSVQPGFALRSVYPNPARSLANIAFSTQRDATISIDVFDVAGRRVATLFDGRVADGEHTVSWNSARMPSGVYHVRLTGPGVLASKKVMIVQ